MQTNFFVASDICKALKALICYYFLLYIKLLMTFFFIDANITPTPIHIMEQEFGGKWVWELSALKGKGKEQGLHVSHPGRVGKGGTKRPGIWQFSHCWPSGGTIGPRLLGFQNGKWFEIDSSETGVRSASALSMGLEIDEKHSLI